MRGSVPHTSGLCELSGSYLCDVFLVFATEPKHSLRPQARGGSSALPGTDLINNPISHSIKLLYMAQCSSDDLLEEISRIDQYSITVQIGRAGTSPYNQ